MDQKRTLHLLVVGEPNGIGQNLAQDIAIVAWQAGLQSDQLPLRLNRNTPYVFYTDEHKFVLLLCPTKDVLTETFTNNLATVDHLHAKIYFCGHGSTNTGAWFLWEGTERYLLLRMNT